MPYMAYIQVHCSLHYIIIDFTVYTMMHVLVKSAAELLPHRHRSWPLRCLVLLWWPRWGWGSQSHEWTLTENSPEPVAWVLEGEGRDGIVALCKSSFSKRSEYHEIITKTKVRVHCTVYWSCVLFLMNPCYNTWYVHVHTVWIQFLPQA